MLVALIDHHNDRRFAAVTLDDLQPVMDIAFLLAGTRVDHKQLEAAAGEEKLMRGMHNLLAAKIPHVNVNFFKPSA